MRCPRCESDTPNGPKFCIECGTVLKPRCPQCEADTLPWSKFCGGFGMPPAGLIPVSSPAHSQLPLADTPVYLSEQIATSLKDEREHVTVLFADLTGSVEWFAEGAPEEAHDLVDPMMARMTAAWIIGRGPVTRRIWHV